MAEADATKAGIDGAAEVAIVGGGLAGLTLAAALGGAGVQVAVIDRAAAAVTLSAEFDGRVSAIAAGGARLLRSIGVWQAMASEAQPILGIRVSDGDSRLFLHYDHRALAPGRDASGEDGAEPLGHIVENRTIRRALLRRIADLPGVRLIERRAVSRVERDGFAARLLLDGGETVAARLAVAADGRDSAIRRGAGIGVMQWRYGQSGIVCTVAHERPHRGIAHERFLTPGPFAILPMTGNRSSLVWTERSDEAERLVTLGEERFVAEIARRFGHDLGRLRVEGPRFAYPLSLLHADTYFAPRLALIGDAAHTIHPIAGQGFNLGLRDVAALAEVVVDARRLGLDIGSTATLEDYGRWRRFDSSVMIAVTDGLNRLFSNDIAPLRAVRDLGLAAVERMPGLKRLFMSHAMGLAGELPRLIQGRPL